MKFAKLAALAVAMAYGTSQAAVITFQTGFSDAGVQSSAEAYRSIVDAAVANSSHSTVLSNYDIVSNQSLFGNGGAFQSFSANTLQLAAVPEPETYAMMLAGLGMVGLVSRRRRRN